MNLFRILDHKILTELSNEIFDNDLESSLYSPLAIEENYLSSFIENNFRIIKKLAEGAFGKVNLVKQNEHLYAEKVVTKDKYSSNEVHTLKLINNICLNGVVKYYHHIENEKSEIIYTEYLQGPTLDEYYKYLKSNNQSIEPKLLTEIAIKLAETIAILHRNNIVHGDIKPTNVILIDRNPVLIDFGSACIIHGDNSYSHGSSFTTPNYTSPELLH